MRGRGVKLEAWISSQDTSLSARTKSTMAEPDRFWLSEKTLSAATVTCDERDSSASSSAGRFLSFLLFVLFFEAVDARRLRSGTSMPLEISCMRSSCETQVRTSFHEPFRLLPSVTAISSRVLIASMFFGFISMMLFRKVNLASVPTNALRSSSMSKTQPMRIALRRPSRHCSTTSMSSVSWSCAERPARKGIHATSNIKRTCSMREAE